MLHLELKRKRNSPFVLALKFSTCFLVPEGECCWAPHLHGYVLKPRDFTARYLALQLSCVRKL